MKERELTALLLEIYSRALNGDELAARDTEALATLMDNPHAGVTLHTDDGAKAAAEIVAPKKSTLRGAAAKAGLAALATAPLVYGAYNKKRLNRSAKALLERAYASAAAHRPKTAVGGPNAVQQDRVNATTIVHPPEIETSVISPGLSTKSRELAYSRAMSYARRHSRSAFASLAAGLGVVGGGMATARRRRKIRRNNEQQLLDFNEVLYLTGHPTGHSFSDDDNEDFEYLRQPTAPSDAEV